MSCKVFSHGKIVCLHLISCERQKYGEVVAALSWVLHVFDASLCDLSLARYAYANDNTSDSCSRAGRTSRAVC